MDGSRYPGGSEVPPPQLGNSSLVHSVHNLVEGIPPLSFNDVLLASLSRSNGAHSGERKPPMFDDLPPPNFMGAAAAAAAASARDFLVPSPSKRMRKFDNSSFMEGRMNENLYEKLFSSANDPVTTAGAANSGTAIDLSLNASC